MEKNQIDMLSLIAIILSIIIALFSPSIPRLSKQTMIIILITTCVLLILLLLIIVYLDMSKRIKIIEDKNEKLENFEEKFKTTSDLLYMKAKLEMIEKKVFKK